MLRKLILSMVILAVLSAPAFAGEDITLYDSNDNILQPSQIDQASVRKTCGDCHDVDEQAKSLHFNMGDKNPDPEMSECISCHMPQKNAFNSSGNITKAIKPVSSDTCASCHPDNADALAESVHGKASKHPGDHPTCVSCHGSPHKITPPSKLTQKEKVELCSSCHADKAIVKRNGLDAAAVSSYNESFHGKALLRFGKENSAGCTDCHGSHDILAQNNPNSAIHRNNITKTCATCHPGANINFSTSGANHLRIKINSSPILWLEDIFFKLLTGGTMLFLMGMIALDLRKKVFCKDCAPKSGRFVAALISISFTSLAVGLVMAVAGIQGAEWAWIASVSFMVIAFAIHKIRGPRKGDKTEKAEKRYLRFTAAQRAQHICLAVSFTVLVLTGMPLRFAHVEWAHYLHLLFGGFDNARLAHKAAAILMTGTWLWHFFFLIYRWKVAGFSLKSWTMWPNRKDFKDFFDTLKYGFGLSGQKPRYDRFQFREKFDYFAVYWGMPIMVFSGAVLWFPVYFSNKLTDLGFGVAFIAHSDEALLAMLAILVWHLYNTHFDPEHFPMSNVWYSGVLTESEMLQEHPIEKEKLDSKASAKNSDATAETVKASDSAKTDD